MITTLSRRNKRQVSPAAIKTLYTATEINILSETDDNNKEEVTMEIMEITVMMEKANKTCISLQAKASDFIEKETLTCGFCEILRLSFSQNTSVHSTS